MMRPNETEAALWAFNFSKKWLLFSLAILQALPIDSSRAAITIGTQTSAITDGRALPGLHLGVDISEYRVRVMSTGVSSQLYYQSAWSLEALSTWSAGQFLWGPVTAGFGGGLLYEKRGFRLTPNSALDESDDFVIGPAFQVAWKIAGPIYITVDAIFGLQGLNFFALNFQHVTSLGLGLEF